MRAARATFLPLAVVFGILTILFLALGQQIWVAFLPLTITFAILSASRRDDHDPDDDHGALDGPDASGDAHR